MNHDSSASSLNAPSSRLVVIHLSDPPNSSAYGGDMYLREVAEVAKQKHQVHLVADAKSLFFGATAVAGCGCLHVFSFPWIPCRLPRNSIIVFHHYAPKGINASQVVEPLALMRLQTLRGRSIPIVAVSRYWKTYLETKGFPSLMITTVYNKPPALFHVSDLSDASWQGMPNVNEHFINIYIGNASRHKGIYDVYKALACLARIIGRPITFWVSGSRYASSFSLRPHMRFFDGDDRQFQLLLSMCDLSIFASRFPEGWNRTMELACLCSPWVIYKPTGGMIELASLYPRTCIPFATPADLLAVVIDVLDRNKSSGSSLEATKARQDSFADDWNSLLSSKI